MDAMYTFGLRRLNTSDIVWESDQFWVALVSSAYEFDASHEYLSSVGAANILAEGLVVSARWEELEGVTGATSDDVLLYGAATNKLGVALVIYQYTGNPETSILVAYIDSYIGLPTSPDGIDDILLIWPHGPEKIFTLAGAMGVSEGVRGELAIGTGECGTNPTGLSNYMGF